MKLLRLPWQRVILAVMGERHWAFMIPLFGFAMISPELPYLAGEVGTDHAAAIGFGAGLVLGAVWFLLHARDLARRLLVMSGLTAVGYLADGLFPGPVEVDRLGLASVGIGIVAGLVLTERWRGEGGWRHQKRGARTSRATMRS